MQSKDHWERIYSAKAEDEVSWFQEHATLSLKLIQDSETSKSASIIDVGGGASTLVDDLLRSGYASITVLDLSGAALAKVKARLGDQASRVSWVEANVTDANFPMHSYDVWHDRAVFHFLNTTEERYAYVQAMLHAVKPGGLVIVATFAEDGPTHCSGLPVQRYSVKELHAEFGESFLLLGYEKELHHTPGGKEQKFVYCFFRKVR